jgi:acetyl esterase/lipase
MKKTILRIFLLTGLFASAQNRYLTELFPNVTTTSGVNFSTNIPTVKTTNLFGYRIANEESYGEATTTLKMDIYQPTGDTNTNRPVIIFAFGGGFVNGSRTENSMVKLCQAFAKRGFVTASIDYRLGMNISDEELSKRAV